MKITLSRLNVGKLATLSQRVIESSKNGQYKLAEEHPLLKNVEKEYEAYNRAYNKTSYSGKGMEVAQADERRDKAFMELKNFLKGYSTLSIAPHHASAVELNKEFEKLSPKVIKLSYAEQTAQFKKLIEILDMEGFQTHFQALNILPAYTELKNAQADFESLFLTQAEANAELRNQASATSIRRALEKSLKDYFSFLTAMQDVKDWALLYKEINELAKAVK